jgi:hypothetical protein
MGFHKTAQLFGTGVGDYSCVKPAYAFVLLLYSQYNKLFVNVLSAFCVFFLTTKTVSSTSTSPSMGGFQNSP